MVAADAYPPSRLPRIRRVFNPTNLSSPIRIFARMPDCCAVRLAVHSTSEMKVCNCLRVLTSVAAVQ